MIGIFKLILTAIFTVPQMVNFDAPFNNFPGLGQEYMEQNFVVYITPLEKQFALSTGYEGPINLHIQLNNGIITFTPELTSRSFILQTGIIYESDSQRYGGIGKALKSFRNFKVGVIGFYWQDPELWLGQVRFIKNLLEWGKYAFGIALNIGYASSELNHTPYFSLALGQNIEQLSYFMIETGYDPFLGINYFRVWTSTTTENIQVYGGFFYPFGEIHSFVQVPKVFMPYSRTIEPEIKMGVRLVNIVENLYIDLGFSDGFIYKLLKGEKAEVGDNRFQIGLKYAIPML